MNKLVILLSAATLAFTACNSTNTTDNKDKTAVESPKDTTKTPEKAVSGYKVGDEATDFSLKNVDGKQVSLADYKEAKGYIVVFTCNHCPYAKAYEQRIVDLDKKYASLGYPVIAISPNDPVLEPKDSYEEMQKLAKEKKYTFPYLIDEKQDVYPKYGATKTPHVFVLQKENGKNIVKYIGAIDDNYEHPKEVKKKYAELAVDALLAGKPIEENTTLAIGCSIKDKRAE
ncbi:thioredoxin family protein [Taibaiella sp. KBW10]|uniref:redoxin domain-containing protein n=1 Tax=Taibaiella sp. KBW10 TaxID=2153357 RepID=UPI000F59AFB1|nr:redoxin domain-containing protein [Taibaiella sp. KBW10]RQO29772.1 thioredoxin family protein [Taibaiella sp. KBW10]